MYPGLEQGFGECEVLTGELAVKVSFVGWVARID